MKIRYKLLILLLCVSLSPILVMRFMAQSAMFSLSEELSGQVADYLVAQAKAQLLQVVEMHVELLGRERRAVNAALELQADAVRKRLTSPVPDGASPETARIALPGRGVGADMELGGNENNQTPPAGERGPLAAASRKQAYIIPQGGDRTAFDDDIARLEPLADDFAHIRKMLNDAPIRQLAVLPNRLTAFFPGQDRIPAHADLTRARWRRLAAKLKGPSWSPPFINPFTRSPVLCAAMPVFGENDRLLAVTAMFLPLGRMLGMETLMRHVSPDTKAFLVNVSDLDGEKRLRVAARRRDGGQRRTWNMPEAKEWLQSGSTEQLRAVLEDVENRRAAVRRLEFEGRDALWAYAPAKGPGSLMVIAPVADVLAASRAAESYVKESIADQFYTTGAIGFVVVCLTVILSIFGSRSVTRPITRLAKASRKLAGGDFSTRVEVKGKDEISELGRLFNTVVPQLKDSMRMRESLELAMEVQRSLLPAAPPAMDGLDIAAVSIYCDETGGDYYDFFTLEGDKAGRLGVAVGDVTGHGVGAALLMTTARALLRPRVKKPGDPAVIAADVNNSLTDDTYGTGRFMTLYYAEIDPVERSIAWVRAGHDPAMLLEPDTGAFAELGGKGVTLGVIEGAAYEGQTLAGIKPGGVLFIGSDGIWEARNTDNEMFGKKRLRQTIRQNADKPAADIMNAVTAALDDFCAGRPLEDDVTLVVVKFQEAPAAHASGGLRTS